LKLPNVFLGLLLLLFIADYKKISRVNFRLLLNPTIVFFAFFSIYLWIKAALTGTITESKYDLLLLILIIPALFLRIKDVKTVLFGAVFSGVLLIVPATIKLANYYLLNKEILPFEGLQINEMLGMERPYMGFFLIGSILAAVFLARQSNKYRYYFYAYAVISACFIFYISARIASGTLAVLVSVYLLFYFKTKIKTKIAVLSIALLVISLLMIGNKNLRDRFFLTGNLQTSVAKFERHEPRFIIWPCAIGVAKSDEHNTAFGLVSEQRLDTLMTRCYDKTITNRHRANFFVKSTLNTHNQFLNIYLTSGLMGLVLVFMFFISFLIQVKKHFLSVALVVAVFLFFCVENVLHRQLGAYYFGLLLAFALFADDKIKENKTAISS
jgi:O-antigen ligase